MQFWNTLIDELNQVDEDGDWVFSKELKADDFMDSKCPWGYFGVQKKMDILPEGDLFFRIEVEHNLYYGLCGVPLDPSIKMGRLGQNSHFRDWIDLQGKTSDSWIVWDYTSYGEQLNFKSFSSDLIQSLSDLHQLRQVCKSIAFEVYAKVQRFKHHQRINKES